MTKSKSLWFERAMVMIASINLGLVLFDVSYIPWRNFWLKRNIEFYNINISVPLPPITNSYDQIKGIEPHRDTQDYLNLVNTLENKVAQSGLKSPEVQKILIDLGDSSKDMIEKNPFQVANKTGTLETIKRRIRQQIKKRTGENIDSSRESFKIFWSESYLSQYGWTEEIKFFNQKIKPLIETNYFRHYAENGEFIDKFWLIDLPFMLIFGLEFMARNYYLRKRNPGLSITEAIIWRWYDILLFIPIFQWLRIIPVTMRLSQAKLLDLEPMNKQLNQMFISNFAEELTEIVVLRVIGQVQTGIKEIKLSKILSTNKQKNAYIDLNNINEIEAIAKIIINLIITDILPKIEPDLEAILEYNIQKAMNEIPGYKNLQNFPGMTDLSKNMREQLVKQIFSNLYLGINKIMEEDPMADKLIEKLIENTTEVIKQELEKNQTLEKIQLLLVDFLEEVKINYVQNLSPEEFDKILQQSKEMQMMKSLP